MEDRKLIARPKNYGSICNSRSYDLTTEQLRAAGEQKQVYSSFPFFNDVINLAVGQMKALFNQEVLTPSATHARLKQILNYAVKSTENELSRHLAPLIRALLVDELTDENFVSIAESVSLELTTMNDTVKRDFIFVLNCSLSVLEGVEKNKVIECIGRFEKALKKEQSADVASVLRSIR